MTFFNTTLPADLPSTPPITNITSFTNITEPIRLPFAYTVSFYVVRCIWSVLSLVGNLLTILVVAKFEHLQTYTNYLACSLALADLIACIEGPFTILSEIYAEVESVFIPTCLAQQTVSLTSTGMNLYSLLWIAIDRFIYISSPLKYHHYVTDRRTLILIAITWAFGIISSTAVVLLGNTLHIGMPCKYYVVLKPAVFYRYLVPQILLLLPMTTGFYIAIAKIAHRQNRAIAAETSETNHIAPLNSNNLKVVKVMSLVLGVYLVSHLPQFALVMVNRVIPAYPTLVLEKITVLIYWSNTWLNPFIYAWKREEFRAAFKKQIKSMTCIY